MEKTRKTLVLGDSQVGKTALIQQLFDPFQDISFLQNQIKKNPKPTTGCMLHVHYLNQYFQSLQQTSLDQQSQSTHSQNYSRSSTHNTRQIYDYFLEFHDISGTFTLSISHTLYDQNLLRKHFDSIIFVFDLNNLKSLNSIRMFMKLLPLILQIDTRSINRSIQISKEEQDQMND
eukprot:403346834